MRQICGMSKTGNLKEAIASVTKPELLLLMSTKERFAQHVAELEEAFPGVPSIGCVGMSYSDRQTNENGVSVIAMTDGVKAVANVIEELSVKPMQYIRRLEEDLQKVGAESRNTVCFDFCCGSDGRLVTTLNTALASRRISLIGGTGDCNMVSANGRVYEDACVYLVIKNLRGKITTCKENIYRLTDQRFVATKTDPAQRLLIEIDGKPAVQAYREALGISEKDVATQTFVNPLGRSYGSEIYLISIQEVCGKALKCYKQVNNMDFISIMEQDDYREVLQETIRKIRSELPHVSAILSVNCMFRYLFFQDKNYWEEYLSTMQGCGTHAGLVGFGEHYNKQHVNQTMCCVAFE